jgi:signal transduction histidine kinase
MEFYQRVKNSLIVISVWILMMAFSIGIPYYQRFVNIIIGFKKQVKSIGMHHWDTNPILIKHELGDLTAGIYEMGARIEDSIAKLLDEKKLSLAVEKLQVIEKKQNFFIGSITHKFKTPLTSIIAFADLLEIYKNDPKLLEGARINISKESYRLLEMLEQVLSLKSIPKFAFEYPRETSNFGIDEGYFVENSVESSKIQCLHRKKFSPAEVYGNKGAMIQIFMNLLDNAIKYNRENGCIWVDGIIFEKTGQLHIKDTGIGIPEEFQIPKSFFKIYFPNIARF